MSERDVMELLSEANPVRLEHLSEPAVLVDPTLTRPRARRARLLTAVVAAMVVAAAAAAIAVAAGAFSGPGPVIGVGSLPTIEHPLSVGSKVPLANAAVALGRPIVLPDTSVVSAADVGSVWLNRAGGRLTVVAVTFPDAGVWIDYQRGDNYDDDVLLQYRAIAREDRRSFKVIDLDGIPALAGGQSSDRVRKNLGSVEFYAAGIRVTVYGHDDRARLHAVAQSILDRSPAPPSGQLGQVGNAQLFTYFPPGKRIRLADASAALGAPVVLPDTPLAKASEAGPAWTERSCPARASRSHSLYACWLWISFPAAGLSVGYLRPPMYVGTGKEWRLQARLYGAGARTVDLNGARALAIAAAAPYPASVEFDLRGTRIVVIGGRDVAALQAVARSIVDRSRSQ